MSLIFAFTEPRPGPAYVNLTATDTGARLTVRGRGAMVGAHIDLDPEQLDALARGILDHLYKEVP